MVQSFVTCYNNSDEQFTIKWEKLELKKSNGLYTGKWVATKKTLPISFTLFSAAEMKHPYADYSSIQKLKEEEPFDYVRTVALQFIKIPLLKRLVVF